MNIFTTDHPMVLEPSAFRRRVQRWLSLGVLFSALSYPVYLFLLGPLYAATGSGLFDFLPQSVRDAWFAPAAPVYCVPGVRNLYDDYLAWWYNDPNAPDRETGW